MAKVNYWTLCEFDGPENEIAHPFGPLREDDPTGEKTDPRHIWVQLDSTDGYYIWRTWDFLTLGIMDERYRGLNFRNFTYDVATKTWTVDEPYQVSWQEVRDTRTARLSDTDWVVVKYTELGQPLPAEWATWRQDLRNWPKTQQDAGYTAQQSLENLNFHFDPVTRARRVSLGLPLEPTPHTR